MANLLPTADKAALLSEHRERFFIIIIWCFVITAIIGAVLLLPSLFLSLSVTKDLQNRLDATKQLIAVQKVEGVNEEITKASEYISLLERSLSYTPPTKLLDVILSAAPEGVGITHITYSQNEGTVEMTLTGDALSRELLLSFAESLRVSPVFSQVDLPITQLAKRNNLTFTLTLKIGDESVEQKFNEEAQ